MPDNNPPPSTTLDAKTQTFMDVISSKIGDLSKGLSEALLNIRLTPGSDSYKKIHTKQLRDKYNASKQTYEHAPLDLSLAEKNMYEYNSGNEGGDMVYTSLIVDRFATTAKELQQNSIEKQQEFMANLAQALRQHQAQTVLLNRTEELLQTRQKENDDLNNKIELYNKLLHTNQRKVVYELKDSSSLYTWRRVILFFYYGAIIVYIIFGNFIPDKLYSKVSVWLIIIILCVIPIILNLIMKWIFVIGEVIGYWFKNDMPHRDVYADLKD